MTPRRSNGPNVGEDFRTNAILGGLVVKIPLGLKKG
jgi:hypothetical protein